MPRSIRFFILIALSALCIGMIVHSAGAVRYSVGSEKLSEFAVTELSLSHEIERGHNGKLRRPGEEPEHTTESVNKLVGDKKPEPQAAAGKQVAAVKPAPKKQTTSKPAPKAAVKKTSAKTSSRKSSSSKPAVKAPVKKTSVKKPAAKPGAPPKPAQKEAPPKKPAKKPCPT